MMNASQHETWMKIALKEAQRAFDMDEVPVGAIVVKSNHIIGKGYNPVSYTHLTLPTKA